MGITYHANSDTKAFDINYSATILGMIHATFELPLADYGENWPKDQPINRVPYKATEVEAKQIGEKLATVTDEQLEEHHHTISHVLLADDAKTYIKWVRGWQSFLLTCNGYDGT